MSKRIPIKKTVRFEVFKRDRFTCQYCGAKAPEVVLHVDHIKPVAEGGATELINLVTACAACNLGKGARTLDDRSAVERQRAQVEELQARREQLEMMLQWRDQEHDEKVDAVEEIAARIADRAVGLMPNENGKANIRRWLKRFTVAEILAAMDESFDVYLTYTDDKPDKDAWEKAFSKIPAFANIARQSQAKPYLPRLAYIQGILRNRTGYARMNFIEALEQCHVDDDVPLDDLERWAKQVRSWDEFNKLVEEWLEDRF